MAVVTTFNPHHLICYYFIGYIISLLTFNVAAFVIVFFCYVSIFQQVRGSNASMASDTNLAKRMALLVFTDFICWGPVAIVAALSAGESAASLDICFYIHTELIDSLLTYNFMELYPQHDDVFSLCD